MTDVQYYRGGQFREDETGQPVPSPDAMETNPKEVPPPPSLMLAAMLVRRVRVEFADGMHWMSGYDALATVLGERSAAGDARASMMLSSLARYAALSDPKDLQLPSHVAPQTDAERTLAAAFVRRTLAGLEDDAPGKRRKRTSARRARRISEGA